LAAGVGLWYQSVGIREAARRAAGRACHGAGLQLLDDTVAFSGLALRWRRGAPVVMLRYRFEYSRDGEERLPGEVRCIGRRAVAIQVEDEWGTTILDQ
jgi:hypothetical protein